MMTIKKEPADGQRKKLSSARQDPKIIELQGKIAELTEQVKKFTNLAGRAQADLQNAKVRMEKSGEELRKFASEALLLKLLPTVDNFQRAFQHLPAELKTNEWVRGVSTIEQDLMRQLHDMGLRKMESLGTPVDATKHEVLTAGPGEEGKVIEVFEEGYELHGKVLRPAKVKAGSHPLM